MTLDDVKIHLIDSVDEAGNFMRWLGERHGGPGIGFDTETTGLSPETDRVRLVQYGDTSQGWVIPFERWGGVVEEAVKRYDGTYIMHNATYDVAMMEHEGVKMPRRQVHDTRLQAHVLDSTGQLGLKALAAIHVDGRAMLMQKALDELLAKRGPWSWATVPIDLPEYWTYAGLDPILTYQLHEVQHPKVMAEAPRAYELELAVAWVAERMMRNGVRIDRTYTRDLRDGYVRYVAEVRAWLKEYYGITNAASNPQVIETLVKLGLPVSKLTEGGLKVWRAGGELQYKHFSADKDVLSGIYHPLVQAVLAQRQADKLAGTYLTTYLELTEGDRRIHPSINTIGGTNKSMREHGGKRGVRTGRMSMNNPNFQNVPIRTKEGKLIRDCFVAEGYHIPDAQDGNVWIKADFDQIEMRLFAHLNRDPRMRQAFLSEGDFFVNMAQDIFQDPTIEKSDPRRQPVKNSGYAWIYGAGLDKFAVTAGMYLPDGSPDVAGAAAFMSRTNQLYPGAQAFINQVMNEGRQHAREEGVAYTRSPLTNRKYVADVGREYPLVNYKIQGTAGELLKLKMVEAAQAGLDEFMIIPVHDELDFDVPRERYEDVITTIRDVMNDDRLLSIPITTSLSVGTRWGSLVDV